MNTLLLAIAVTAAGAMSTRAQEPARTVAIEAPPVVPPQVQEERERVRRPLPTRNVKVDVTISDQTSTGTPMKKVVTLVVADGRSSGVRSTTQVPVSGMGIRGFPLNIDTTVAITPEGRVLLDLRFNYGSLQQGGNTPASDGSSPREPSSAEITETLSVLLTPGAPVVVSRSADAASDRTVTVEVKAEVLK